MELLRVEFSQIKSLDQHEQTFGVRCFLQFVIRNGAKEYHEDALPTSGFRSAEWLMTTFRWHNAAHQPTELDHRVVRMGDDLHLVLEVEAAFFEQMELESFPWDHQACTVVLKVSCANEGSAPVRLTGLHTAARNIDLNNFALSNVFHLEQSLEVFAHSLSPMVGRTYPCIVLTAHLHRRSLYYVFNIIFPMAMFALMTMLMRAVPVTQVADRLAISMTMVLTMAAYKSNISTMMPPISYLTLIDKYVLLIFLMAGVMVLWNIVGLMLTSCATDCVSSRRSSGTSSESGAALTTTQEWGFGLITIEEARKMDDWFIVSCIIAWVGLQLWLAIRVRGILASQAKSALDRSVLVAQAKRNAAAYDKSVSRRQSYLHESAPAEANAQEGGEVASTSTSGEEQATREGAGDAGQQPRACPAPGQCRV